MLHRESNPLEQTSPDVQCISRRSQCHMISPAAPLESSEENCARLRKQAEEIPLIALARLQSELRMLAFSIVMRGLWSLCAEASEDYVVKGYVNGGSCCETQRRGDNTELGRV